MNDSDLLQAYVETKSEDAFAELVRRHLDLVFSAALRQVGGDSHLAQDVAQTVFNDLARKAGSLSSRTVLSGWLYTSARFAAAKIVRTEQRRVARERESQFMNPPDQTDPPDWDRLQTVLDDAMHDLKDTDRDAVLLRYFKGCSFEDVGKNIGVSSDSARMRVDRALEKLRKCLAKRGVVSSSAALAVVLTQQTISAAPAGLAAIVASSAVSAASVGTAAGIFHFMAITKTQAVAMAVVVAGFTVPIVLQYQANQRLEQTNQALLRQHAETVAELEPLKTEVQRLNALAAKAPERAGGSNEVFQLRAEVARLREAVKQGARTRSIVAATRGDDPVQETLRSLGLRAQQLKEHFARMPETHIPELALVSEKDWLDAAASVESMQSEVDARKALNSLRSHAKQKFGNQVQKALRKFAEANGDALPSDLSQLQPYFEQPIDPAMLGRYRMIQGGGKYTENNPESDRALVEEIATPVDQEYDSLYQFYRNGTSSRSYNAISDALENATRRYAEANNGQLPRSASQLAGLLPPNIDAQRVSGFLAKIPADVMTYDQYRAAGRR
jgi:RNA polymerase sigma factor (sigma-70 family)